MNADKILKSYGLRRVARVLMEGGKFIIEVEDKVGIEYEKTIYAFVIGDEIVRIGSSKGKLKRRFHAWERDVTKRFQGKNSSTPQWEAEGWRERLEKHKEGSVFARKGTEITTSVGTFPVYLDEESVLIGRHLPPLNGSRHR